MQRPWGSYNQRETALNIVGMTFMTSHIFVLYLTAYIFFMSQSSYNDTSSISPSANHKQDHQERGVARVVTRDPWALKGSAKGLTAFMRHPLACESVLCALLHLHSFKVI